MLKPTASSPKTAIQAWAKQEAQAEYGDSYKADIAVVSMGHGVDYMHTMPIGWNYNNTSQDFSNRLHGHILSKVKADPNIKPVGILAAPLLGWLFWEIVSGIISWVIEKLLDIYYPTNK